MQIKHIPVRTASILPKGLLQYVDRGTLELCLHLIVLSLSLVSGVYHDFIYLDLVHSTLDTAVGCTYFIKSYGFTCHYPSKQFSAHMCFDFLSFSFVKVMAGSGNLQIFRLLRYLRGRMSAEGQVNYGLQMAVSIVNSFGEQICFSLKSNTED